MTLDLKLAETPIALPDHPYIASLKDFGLDELLAGGFDAFTTTVANLFLDASVKGYVLPLIGPVFEKVAFFPVHFKKAWNIYRTMPEHKRQYLGHYFKKALKEGSGNLLKDILIHDPIYIALMAYGLSHTDLHPGVLSALSYIIGVALVAGIDVAKHEALFARQRKKFRHLGFEQEQYYEARFFVKSEMNPEEIMARFIAVFGLVSTGTVRYHDTYFENTLPSFSGRTAKLRLRYRGRRKSESQDSMWGSNGIYVSSAQIIYTRTRENKGKLDQCRYFPAQKNKMYFLLPEPVETIEEISDDLVRQTLLSCLPAYRYPSQIVFERTTARNDSIALCADTVFADRDYYVVEVKAYTHARKELLQAMRYIMIECPLAVVQTTYGKVDLFS